MILHLTEVPENRRILFRDALVNPKVATGGGKRGITVVMNFSGIKQENGSRGNRVDPAFPSIMGSSGNSDQHFPKKMVMAVFPLPTRIPWASDRKDFASNRRSNPSELSEIKDGYEVVLHDRRKCRLCLCVKSSPDSKSLRQTTEESTTEADDAVVHCDIARVLRLWITA